MYRCVFFTLVALAASSKDDDLEVKCRHSFHPGVFHCCINAPDDAGMFDGAEECNAMPRSPTSCERELCVLKKNGLLTDDGELDKAKLETMASETFKGQTDLLSAVKAQCLEGDLKLYGAPDFCELIKIRNCFKTQYFTHCPEWSNASECKGLKETAEACSEIYS